MGGGGWTDFKSWTETLEETKMDCRLPLTAKCNNMLSVRSHRVFFGMIDWRSMYKTKQNKMLWRYCTVRARVRNAHHLLYEPQHGPSCELTHFSLAAVASSSRFCDCLVVFSRLDACFAEVLPRALASGASAFETRRWSPSRTSRCPAWLYLMRMHKKRRVTDMGCSEQKPT